MAIETTPFDPAEYLDTDEAQAEFFDAAGETGDVEFVLNALAVAARARGMKQVAAGAGMARTALYRALGGNPTIETVTRIAKALNSS